MGRRSRPARVDTFIAAGFVLAAAVEAAVTHTGHPPQLVSGVLGALFLAVLALRRTLPVVVLCTIVGVGVSSTVLRSALWPNAAPDAGGVWIFALILAAYSLGAHRRGWAIVLGGLLPLLLALAIDVPVMSGWTLANDVAFITVVLGVLPTAVGRIVRTQRDILGELEQQREIRDTERRARDHSQVLADRLATTERLQSGLLDGLRTIAALAENGADPAWLEHRARQLLTRTREEVVSLTTKSDPAPQDGEPEPRRRMTRPSLRGLPPFLIVTLGWGALDAFSRLAIPLDGMLGPTLFAVAAGFAIGLLCNGWLAAAGLLVCLAGQLVGVGTDDPVGEGAMILVCWLAGIAVERARRLVQERRLSDRMLAERDAAEARQAIIAERLRLAREVHDQLGHSLTVIVLQAEAARRMAQSQPERARATVVAIATAARAGVAAMESQPDSDVRGMLQRSREAGLRLTADVAVLDPNAGLDEAVREVACRVVQESLTNALRHAPGASAEVVVRRSGGTVTVDVRNGAPTQPASSVGSGTGLVGLRTRVVASGGELDWGPHGQGFRVHAVLLVPDTVNDR